MTNRVEFSLSHDEALVLSNLLARFEQTGSLSLQHNADFIALSRISAALDRFLMEPFAKDYDAAVSHARDRLAEGFEGTAPGVPPDR